MEKNREEDWSGTRIGLGLAAIGRPEYINIRQKEDRDKSFSTYRKNAFNLLDHAYSKGIRDFDVAASYGKGEQFLTDWYYKRRHPDVRLSSKWGYTYKANWEIGYNEAHEIKEHSLSKLREQWSFAKKLLPGLKTYQIHSATFESGVLNNSEVLQELDRIKEECQIQIGVSVSGENQREVLLRAAEVLVGGRELFDSFQATFNLLDTSAFNVLTDLLNNGKSIIVKEAMANGRLLRNKIFPHYESLYNAMHEISKVHNVEPDAVALRFVIDSLRPTLVLSGASSVQQLDSNLKACTFELSPQELSSLGRFSIEPHEYWSERKGLRWN